MDNNKRVIVDRRGFLKLTGIGLSGFVLQPSDQTFGSTLDEDEVAILYDASKCIGCRTCEGACKECNNLPAEPAPPSDLSAITWNLIKQRKGVDWDLGKYRKKVDEAEAEAEAEAETDRPFFNLQCMHCTDAACVMVCPTGALYKDKKGFIAIDEDKCNGCGYCTQFCPFGVPALKDVNLITGEAKAGKCIFCCQNQPQEGIGRVACVEACPTGALTLGWRENQLDVAKDRIAQLKANGHSKAMLYGESEAGGLHRLSILLDEPSAYGLPVDPQGPITFSSVWQKIIQPLGELALGATILGVIAAFFVTRRNIRMEEVE